MPIQSTPMSGSELARMNQTMGEYLASIRDERVGSERAASITPEAWTNLARRYATQYYAPSDMWVDANIYGTFSIASTPLPQPYAAMEPGCKWRDLNNALIREEAARDDGTERSMYAKAILATLKACGKPYLNIKDGVVTHEWERIKASPDE